MSEEDKLRRETEQWKKKYYASLEQAEKQERESAEREQQLRRHLLRLSLAADGVDPSLDRLLDRLRGDIRDGHRTSIMARVINEIGERAAALEKERRARPVRPPQEILGQILDRLELPRDVTRQGKALGKALSARDAAQNLDSLVEDFSRLLMAAIMTSPPASEAQNGLIGKLFGKSSTPAGDIPQNESPPGSVRPRLSHDEALRQDENHRILDQLMDLLHVPGRLQESLEHLRHELHVASSNAEISRIIARLASLLSEASEKPAGDKASLNQAQDILLQLLDRIVLPEELSAELENIRKQIETGAATLDINEILEALAGLISKTLSLTQTEKEDLEGFLKQITESLAEIDRHIRTAQGYQQSAVVNGQQLDDAVNGQMREIQDSLHHASDLADLKSAIQQRLEAIRSHLRVFREAEGSRHQLVEGTMQSLVNRLTQLESESEELKEHLRKHQDLALRDPLTGINNRQAYEDHLAHAFGRWKRQQEPLTLVVWDIDHFKRINDEFGHQAGDKALKLVARMLKNRLRESDYVARYGGEEFVTLMPGTALDAALRVADQLRATIAQAEFHYGELRVPVTISCGLAQFGTGDTPESVFKRADDALYLAKRSGRNRCKTQGDPGK